MKRNCLHAQHKISYPKGNIWADSGIQGTGANEQPTEPVFLFIYFTHVQLIVTCDVPCVPLPLRFLYA